VLADAPTCPNEKLISASIAADQPSLIFIFLLPGKMALVRNDPSMTLQPQTSVKK
jgi:hypothetical protein